MFICLFLLFNVQFWFYCASLQIKCTHARLVYVKLLHQKTHGTLFDLSAVGDTCTAMDQWVQYPQAETALSNILPCVDQQTTNQTLHQSKDVIRQLVNIVNTVIWTVANSYSPPQNDNSYFYNQSGPLMPPLCSPYDSQLHSLECSPYEVSFDNASVVSVN